MNGTVQIQNNRVGNQVKKKREETVLRTSLSEIYRS